MKNHTKISPVLFPEPPLKKESLDGWEIVLRYGNENPALSLVDLSHKGKWDLYDQNLAGKSLENLQVPGIPGEVTFSNGTIVALYQPSTALVWQMDSSFEEHHFPDTMTEITDGYALIALIGDKGPAIMEKLTDLDLMSPSTQKIRLIQGPLLGVSSKFVLFSNEKSAAGMLISFDRGSGQPLVDAILDAGKEFGLTPAGQNLFDKWVQNFA